LRVRGRLKNKTQMVRYIETDVQYIVCMCPEWTDLFRIRIGGGSVWLQHWIVGFSERRRTAGVVDGRFGQTALGYTELHKRCVQEQSSRSVKLSTNLRLIPRLSICGAYCHFPIQFKMLFRAIFVPKKYFFSGMWRNLLWQLNKDVLNFPTAFILWLFFYFEGGGRRYHRNVGTSILLSTSQQTIRLTTSDVRTWTHILSRSTYYSVDLQRVTWFCSLKCPFVSA
jgi:hypothetical protein